MLITATSLALLLAAPTGLSTSQAKTAAPGAVNLSNGTNSEGTSSSFARADHVHAVTNAATALGTCAAGIEGVERWAAGTGGAGSLIRTRLCRCESDGGNPASYAWRDIVSGYQGTAGMCGTLIDPDANTVAHVIWRNGALVDLKGNAWTMGGTVPQVAASGATPPGAGPFSIANYYQLGSGADVMDLSQFTVVVVANLTSAANPFQTAIVNSNLTNNGFFVVYNPTTPTLRAYVSYSQSVVTLVPTTLGAVRAAMIGRSGSVTYARNSDGPTAIGSTTFTQDPGTGVARIGSIPGGNAFIGTIYEIYVTSTPPSTALFASIVAQVSNRIGQTIDWGSPAQPAGTPGLIACVGDSITKGDAAATPWPALLAADLGGGYSSTNHGVNGTNTSQFVTRWLDTVKPTAPKWMTVLGGVVDAIQDVPSDITIENLSYIYADAMASGVRVVPMTIAPFGQYSLWNAGRQAKIDAVNAWIRARGLPYVDLYNSALNDGSGNLAAAYDSGDHLHPNTAGAAYIESLVRAAFP